MTSGISDVYKTANKIFLGSQEGKVFPTVHHINTFFNQAEQLKDKTGKPMYTAAKMILQQAYMDSLEILSDDYVEGEIEQSEFADKTKNISLLQIELQKHPKMLELDRKIRQTHPKTARKRIAIVPCMMDSSFNGLAGVKRSANGEANNLLYKIAYFIVKQHNPEILDMEKEIVENKGVKIFRYWLQKMF